MGELNVEVRNCNPIVTPIWRSWVKLVSYNSETIYCGCELELGTGTLRHIVEPRHQDLKIIPIGWIESSNFSFSRNFGSLFL